MLIGIVFTLFSYGQDFGYLKFNTFSLNGTVQDSCYTVFMFNFNDSEDIIAIDERLVPSLLKSQSDYNLTDGMKVLDGTEVYSLLIFQDRIIIYNELTELIFYNK